MDVQHARGFGTVAAAALQGAADQHLLEPG